MTGLVQPNAWVALKLPSESTRILQITPDTTISLGKYGSFPTNLIIDRPYHLTYEIQDRRRDEDFCRLRVVPTMEMYTDAFADPNATPDPDGDAEVDEINGDGLAGDTSVEYSLVDKESGQVVARSNRNIVDDPSRQTLSMEEIEMLKRDGTDAGKDLIAKLLLSHTALDQKTAYSLEKYKLLKTKKYIRRFTVLPLDAHTLGRFFFDEKDSGRTLELRQEILGLVGCWSNVHFGGDEIFDDRIHDPVTAPNLAAPSDLKLGGRWLVVDDTGGLLVASLAERMGLLHQLKRPGDAAADATEIVAQSVNGHPQAAAETAPDESRALTASHDGGIAAAKSASSTTLGKRIHRRDDLQTPFSLSNTLTIIHANAQPNLGLLRYFDFDITLANPPQPLHPLHTHLLPISWLQLLEPELDPVYGTPPPVAASEEVESWKSNRRGNYHRKRRRWTRTRHIVDATRAGGFSGLTTASTMDPISILQHTLPLLMGGAPIVLYSPTIEPLMIVADCFSIARRAAWTSRSSPELVDKTDEELESWIPTENFPLNPTLVLGVTLQTTRARPWQVLPGRTHPIMSGRGGAAGFVLTAWKAVPAEGKVEARGKFKRRKVDTQAS